MRIDCLSVPKYLSSNRPGDDVPLVMPGRCYAVFDGATDVNGSTIAGVGSGRFAALECAAALASAMSTPPADRPLPGGLVAMLNRRLKDALERESERQGKPVGASTTLVMMEDMGETYRFTLVGDSGLRLNGTEVFQHLKPVDDIMSAGRVALFHHLKARGMEAPELEQRSRQGVFHGFDAAIPELLSAAEAEELIARTREMLAPTFDPALSEHIEPMLRAGIPKGQYRYSNDPRHPMGYAALDGGHSQGPGWLTFERPAETIHTVEIFSDGYLELPQETTLAAWEDVFARIEREDPGKTETHWGVKGSSAEQLFDDRTIIILSGL
ncbi:hypothetical protein [Consotaella salsifontis]|uniref:Protein phosphatase 2C n=1 Tax=Consotaella salsifontis TaxID=1365950 RepID=A0A1T4PIY9_9HYPH|nr:hypothetical protein [Consotaella salsifontis]SJZ91514.1 hypothetical protein SAMN05428963_10412 [Consotaella salsifontis]